MRNALLIALVTSAVVCAPAEATFPGDNGPIAYRTFDFETGLGAPLFLAGPDGTLMGTITEHGGFFSDWRPDGRRIAFDFFEPDGDEQIATANPDGSDLRVITSGRGIHEVPSWSPDGDRIVYDFSPHTNFDSPGFRTRLWTMRADGTDPRPLPLHRPGFDVEPRYSPNGDWIAFGRLRTTREGEWQQAVFIVGATGGAVRQLTPWELDAQHPTWSPDSSWIVFDLAPHGTVQAVRPDGGDRRTILAARPGLGAHKPWFSPDGTRILFMCDNRGTLPEPTAHHNEDLCLMDADGSAIENLTNTPSTLENWPSWGPAVDQPN